MIYKINGISNIALNEISNLSDISSLCKNSKNGIFETVLINLLEAINEKNKTVTNPRDMVSIDNIFETLNSTKLNNINFNSSNLINKINLDDINLNNLSEKDRIEKAINDFSKKYGVDSKLIKSIIKIESDFNPNVSSCAGAKGLMQLMPENCESLGITNPFNIEQNIDGGIRHIKEYLDKYDGNIEMALMAYNGGPTRMMNRGVNSIADLYKMPRETQNYVSKVMSYYKGL